MQVTQTLKDGLKREYRVQVSIAELAEKAESRLEELRGTVNIPGFRKGKVPTSHLKRMYGRSVMAETIDKTVNEVNTKIATDNTYRFAGVPNPKLPEDEAEALKVFDGHADLDYVVQFEILPEIPATDLSAISVEKPVCEVSEEELNDALKNLANSNREYDEKTDAAAKDDALTIDFLGTIDGVAFDGGQADDARLVLGSGQFIPGFEEQLIGSKAGDDVTVTVTFPADYQAADLAGKEAKFACHVSKVEAPKDRAIDEDLAKMVGFESLDKLKDAVKENLGGNYAQASRAKVKRALLDSLDKAYSFELPPSLVEQEFNNVWGQVTSDLQANNKTFEDEGSTEDKAKAEYQAIAERRVRLGLVLAEVGDKNAITVTDDELTRSVIEQVRRYPGQEKQIYDYFKSNQQALAALRAPIFEEKVVDHLLAQVQVVEKAVSKEELFKVEDEEK